MHGIGQSGDNNMHGLGLGLGLGLDQLDLDLDSGVVDSTTTLVITHDKKDISLYLVSAFEVQKSTLQTSPS